MSIILPTVTAITADYSTLPQPAAAVLQNLIPPYNIIIHENGMASFSVAVNTDTPPTTVEYISNDANQNNLNILKVTCSYQTTAPKSGTNVNVYTYTNIDLGVNIPLNTNVYPLSYAPDDSLTNGEPETSRGTVVIVKSGDDE